MFRRLSLKTYSRRRAVTLADVCLVSILGSVVFMNVQTRSGRARAAVSIQTVAAHPVRSSARAGVERPATAQAGSTTARQPAQPEARTDLARGGLGAETQAGGTVTAADLD